MKTCITCKIAKSIENFSKNNSKKDKLEVYCKLCYTQIRKSKDKKYNEKQKEKRAQNKHNDKRYKKELILSYNIKTKKFKEYKNQNSTKIDNFIPSVVGHACRKNISHYGHLWFYKNEFTTDLLNLKLKEIFKPRRTKKIYITKFCKTCKQQKSINSFFSDKNNTTGYTSKCKKCTSTYIINRKNKNPLFKLRKTLSTRVCAALKRNKLQKNCKFNEYLGCSLEILKQHLEKQFQPGMTWKNHTHTGWHIDHIIPLSSAKTEEEMYKLFHYTNLQPLWFWENMAKGNKIAHPEL